VLSSRICCVCVARCAGARTNAATAGGVALMWCGVVAWCSGAFVVAECANSSVMIVRAIVAIVTRIATWCTGTSASIGLFVCHTYYDCIFMVNKCVYVF
jgi:hypothetical protein